MSAAHLMQAQTPLGHAGVGGGGWRVKGQKQVQNTQLKGGEGIVQASAGRQAGRTSESDPSAS